LDVVKLGESLDSKQIEEGDVGEELESHKGVLSNKYLLKLKKQGKEEEEEQEELEVVLSLICKSFEEILH
jgi:hypothetical protein